MLMRVAVDAKITKLFSRELVIFVHYPRDVSFSNFRNKCLSCNKFTVFCFIFVRTFSYAYIACVYSISINRNFYAARERNRER